MARIVVVATSYPSAPGDAAGHFVRADALRLAREGHDVHVVAPAPHHDDALVVHAAGGAQLFGWPGVAARARVEPWRMVVAPVFLARATALVRSLEAHVVRAHWALPCGSPIAQAALQGRNGALELVCHGADVRALRVLPQPLRDALVARLFGRANQAQFVAHSLLESLREALGRAARVALDRVAFVAPPHVDVGDLEPRVDLAHPPSARPFVVCAGRLVREKRVDLAIDAVERLRRDVDLLVVGDGPERRRLEARAASAYGVGERVRFLGLLPRPRVLSLLRSAAALVHPSAVDAAPTIVLEAVALGVPVVSCGAGDVGLWAERRRSIAICPADAEAIGEALGSLVCGAAA